MYERFTDRARKVMQLANQEAQRFNHEYIGTEHILLGLVKEGSGMAANVLKALDCDLDKIRLEVEKLVQSGPDMVTIGKLPQTPRAKKVIEYAMEEARNLNHNYVGTEHLLLGLLREQEGVAAQVLMNLTLDLEDVRLTIVGTSARNAQDDKNWRGATRIPVRNAQDDASRRLDLVREALVAIEKVGTYGRDDTLHDVTSDDLMERWNWVIPVHPTHHDQREIARTIVLLREAVKGNE